MPDPEHVPADDIEILPPGTRIPPLPGLDTVLTTVHRHTTIGERVTSWFAGPHDPTR